MGKMAERAETIRASVETFRHTKGCPACNEQRFACLINLPGVLQCQACEGYYGLTLEATSTELVRHAWADGTYDLKDQRYYDLTVSRGNGEVYRRHGWFLPASGGITQVG